MTRVRRGAWAGDEGSAVVEFVGLTFVLLVPLVYLVLVVGRLEAATFAAEGAAREAARVFVASDEAASAAPRALVAAGVALADQGLHDDPADAVSIACSAACLTPGSEVAVDVRLSVPLPFVPPFLRRAVPLSIPVTAQRTAVVDEYRAAP
ncbi:MAG: pilus assembly protein TadE [Cellulomonas sp. 73-92]|uniref:pilus assembly protein n=1 Tax=Cellulomonas sp. 73-92 TaxID=1895740 RepID=UPI00092C71DD|nr:pilus assembly protein [Cellulomonas sp. 73-92]OJV78957.1 MAG: pilus assembly protein TadE [Cellulomonas sp. 73-92]